MVAPPQLDRITVDDAADRYLRAVHSETVRGVLSPTSRDTYARDIREFVALAGPATILDDVSGDDIDTILVRYQTTPDRRYREPGTKRGGPGRAAASVNRFRQSVSRFFTYAAQHAWVQANPFLWAAPPARDREGLRIERTALSASSARALLDAADDRPDAASGRYDQRLAPRDRLALALLLVIGPRVSELVRADVDDVVREPGAATWRIKGKGGAVRTVGLSVPLERALTDYLADLRPSLLERGPRTADSERALLLSWRGRRIDPQGVRALVSRTMSKVADPYRRGATPHALRHTTATLLVASGWDVKVVAELLGHASIATTGVYLDRIEGELAAAIAAHPVTASRWNDPDGSTSPLS